MVIANELRIGNFVKKGEALFKIKLGSQIDNSDFIYPIILTHEILEKAGAGKDGREYIVRVGALKMKLRYNTKWYCELGDIYLGGKIQSVHQLQNLYFALTGNELKIEL